VADVERCFVDRSAAREALERKTDPARAYVLVKRRSELMLEPSTNPNRVHAGTRERRVRPAVVGCRVDLLQQRTNPVRCAFRLQWHTALTRTVSSFERRDRGRKEFDVLRFRLARRARGPTENARRAHGRNEDAVIGAIALDHRADHFGTWRKHACTVHPSLPRVPPENGLRSPPGRGRFRANAQKRQAGSHFSRTECKLRQFRRKTRRRSPLGDVTDRTGLTTRNAEFFFAA